MPQYYFTDPGTQLAFSNLGRMFSPQVAAQGQLMQAQRGQIDSATERNRALTASELAEEQRRTEMHDARSGLVNALLNPVSQNLAKTMPAGDLYRLFDQNIDAEAIQGIRTPGIDEEPARMNAIILSRGNLPSYTDAATQDGVQNIFNNRRDEAVAVAKQQGDNTIAAEIAKRMYEQQNPAIQEPVRLGEGDRLVNPLTGEIIVPPVSGAEAGFDPRKATGQQQYLNAIKGRINAAFAGVNGADFEEGKDGSIKLNTEVPPAIYRAITDEAQSIAMQYPSLNVDTAVASAIEKVIPGGIRNVSVGRVGGTPWFGGKSVFDFGAVPNLPLSRVSPTPGAPPPATAPTSQSTSQSGAAPGAGDSPQAPLPVPMAGGKVDAASMVRGKYYKGADGVIIYLKPDGSIVQF